MFGVTGVVIGVILLLFGFISIFFLPGSTMYQKEEFGIASIVIGIVCLILGGVLVFL